MLAWVFALLWVLAYVLVLITAASRSQLIWQSNCSSFTNRFTQLYTTWNCQNKIQMTDGRRKWKIARLLAATAWPVHGLCPISDSTAVNAQFLAFSIISLAFIRPKAGQEVRPLNWTQKHKSVWYGPPSKATGHAPRPARDWPVPLSYYHMCHHHLSVIRLYRPLFVRVMFVLWLFWLGRSQTINKLSYTNVLVV